MRLILNKLSRRFPGRDVFNDISLEIEKGVKLVITGPNGSGKTTLLNVISSSLAPTAGTVTFELDGKSYTGSEILPYIGLVSPDLYLYDELTANENLAFFAKLSGLSIRNFDGMLSRFDLESRGDDQVGSYSSGMKQRLKYVLAIMKEPPLLILDEPSANLDEAGKTLVDQVIGKHDGITIIATNESDELKYADETIELGK